MGASYLARATAGVKAKAGAQREETGSCLPRRVCGFCNGPLGDPLITPYLLPQRADAVDERSLTSRKVLRDIVRRVQPCCRRAWTQRSGFAAD